MLTIAECQKYLHGYKLQENQVEELRNAMYCICENIISNHMGNAKTTNKQADRGQ